MKINQCLHPMHQLYEHSPKYWVVHDKSTTDVFLDTAKKAKGDSIEEFLVKHSYQYFGVTADDEIMGKFEESENLSCILIEIKIPLSAIQGHVDKGEIK